MIFFSFILILLLVSLLKCIKRVVNVLSMTVSKFAHGVECVNVIDARTRETMALTSICNKSNLSEMCDLNKVKVKTHHDQ